MTSQDIRRVSAERVDLTDDLAAPIRRDANSGGIQELAASQVAQSKKWVFTWNNPDVSEDNPYRGANLHMYMRSKQHLDLEYMAWSYEMSESGTPHYQGFLVIKNKIRVTTMKAKFNNASIWVMPAVAPSQARDYCLHKGKYADKELVNDGDIWEYGKWNETATQGKRTDLATITGMIIGGANIKTAALADPSVYVKHHSGLEKLAAMFQGVKRSWMTELAIYWGKAGTGKSHRASREAEEYLKANGIDEEVYYMAAPSKKTDKVWMHGYNGEAAVVIDDFYGTIGIDQMKNLIDKYPCKVEVKNGHREWLARKVWITSNQAWETWWMLDLMRGDNKAAIQRRITVCEEMNAVYAVEPEFALPLGILGEGVSDESIDWGDVNDEPPQNLNQWGWEN